MFQDYALFPTMTVARNIVCGMDRRGRGDALDAVPARFELTALARMLAAEPEAILLNEPFSALDEELRDCQDVVLVTHNRSEAADFCGELVLLRHGRVQAAEGGGNL